MIQSPTGRSGRRGTAPVFRLRLTSPTGALDSVASPSPDGLFDRKAWPKAPLPTRTLHSPTEHMPSPCSPLFSDWHDQSRLGPTDWGRPLGRDQEMCGESRARCTSQTMIPGTIPCTHAGTVLCNRPDTNSIVGADISLYSIVGAGNSHTALDIDSVVGAEIYRTK